MKFIKTYINNAIADDMTEGTYLSELSDPQDQAQFLTDAFSVFEKSKLFELCLVTMQGEKTANGIIPPFIMATVDTNNGDSRTERTSKAPLTPYFCSQVNFDFTIRQAHIDASQSVNVGRKFSYLDVIKGQFKAIGINTMTTGFHGKYETGSSNPTENPNGEDVKQGWIAKIVEKGIISYSPDVNGSYEAHNDLALALKSKISPAVLNNTSMVCVVGDGFKHDGIENEDLFLTPTKKTLGNLPTYYVKNMPRGHMMITAKRNLKVVVQVDSVRISPYLINSSKDTYSSLISLNLDYSIGDISKCALLILGDKPTAPTE